MSLNDGSAPERVIQTLGKFPASELQGRGEILALSLLFAEEKSKSMKTIIKAKPRIDPRELYIAAMFAMYLRTPARPTREEVSRGAITDLGEIGSVQEKNWKRDTPYSPARTTSS
jgi:hypothetical protein